MNIIYDFYKPEKRTEDPSAIVSRTTKPVKYRQGWAWKGASIYDSTKEQVLSILQKTKTLIIEDHEDYLLINTFSSNDLL